MKDKNYIINLIDGKSFDIIQYTFMIKAFNELGTEETTSV